MPVQLNGKDITETDVKTVMTQLEDQKQELEESHHITLSARELTFIGIVIGLFGAALAIIAMVM